MFETKPLLSNSGEAAANIWTSPPVGLMTARVDFLVLILSPLSPSPSSIPPLVATLHIICRQHAGLPGPLHGAVHPAFVDVLSVDDDVAIPEGNLVVVLSCVVVQGPVNTLQATGRDG